MGFDPSQYRRESRARWGAAARGWARRRARLAQHTMPVSAWLVDAIEPQPGHQVLELAAGTGEVGFLAAEAIRPGGSLICSDFAPEMLTAAQERAAEIGLDNVRFKQIDAESIDLPAATLDGVICRWGFMLMADPGAALREVRRVLRPGGRLALAAWAAPEANPWSSLIGRELVAAGVLDPQPEGEPGQFAWAREGIIEDALGGAGFVDDIRVEALDFFFHDRDFDEWLSTALDMSARVSGAFAAMGESEREKLRDRLRAAAEPFAQPDGSLRLPARTWVAAASA